VHTGVFRFADELGRIKATKAACFPFAGLTTYGSTQHVPTHSWPQNPAGKCGFPRGGERGEYMEEMLRSAKSISRFSFCALVNCLFTRTA